MAVRRLAKGSGKSPFAAVQAAFAELVRASPAGRLDPVGAGWMRRKRVDIRSCRFVATNEQQTANTMRMVRAFA